MSGVKSRDDESGATLILVLIFLLVIGPILGALIGFAETNLLNTNNFETQRILEFSANTYMEGAIQADRYVLATTSAANACQSSSNNETSAAFPSGPLATSFLPNNESLAVWCDVGTLADINGRIVEFDVCATTTSITSWQSCQTDNVLDVKLIYNDNPTIGTGVNIVTWTLATASH